MIRNIGIAALGCTLIVLASSGLFAEVPSSLHYQAQILDDAGDPVEGIVDIEIGVWDQESDGIELYFEEHHGTALSDGIFSVFLGDGDLASGELGPGLFAAKDRWLELTVDGEVLRPRQRFASVAYALRAQEADRAAEADAVGNIDAEDVVSATGATFSGPVMLRGTNGNINARVTSLAGYPDHGLIAVSDGDGEDLATMSVDSNGQGRFALLDVDGNNLVDIGSEDVSEGDGGGAIIFSRRAGILRTWGRNGSLNTRMASGGILDPNQGEVTVHDDGGIARAKMAVSLTGHGTIGVDGPNGKPNVRLAGAPGNSNAGALSVFDENGSARFRAWILDQSQEQVETRGPNGELNVRMGGGASNLDRGAIGLYDDDGEQMILIASTDALGGVLAAKDPSGSLRASVANGLVAGLGPSGEFNARLGSPDSDPDLGLVAVSDTAGDDRGLMFVDPAGQGVVALNDSSGNRRVELSVSDRRAGFVQTRGSDGSSNVRLTSLATDPDQGFLSVQNSDDESVATLFSDGNGRGALQVTNEDGGLAAALGVSSSGTGFFTTLGENGSENVRLGSPVGSPSLGSIAVANELSETRALMEVIPVAGAGLVATFGPNGSDNVRLTALTQNANHGFVSVHDANGQAQALMLVDPDGQGRIIADVKNFVVDHPTRPGKKIVYASLEGPEAAMYHRGVVALEHGEATIQLPEHFAVLAVPETITVQLTPRSLDSLGVAVDAIDASRIEIAELDGGGGDYDVHYLVHAVRRGFEDYEPVMTNEAFAETSGSPGHSLGALHGNRPIGAIVRQSGA